LPGLLMLQWRDPERRRRLGLLAVGALGALAANILLGIVWPRGDRAETAELAVTPATLAEKPRRPITVLVIGSDADGINAGSNQAAPPGPANADALLLVRVNPKGPLQVLNLPVELAVQRPGDTAPVRLGSLFGKGGVALTADAVRELVGLDVPKPDRYLVLPRGGFRQIVNGIGGLEVSPPRTMKYTDKTLKYKVDLQAGLQRLGGAQVEQLVRYRDKWLGEAGRRQSQQLVVTSLRERLGRQEQLAALPGLLRDLQGKVDTNLSARESMSLLAAGLDDDRPIQYASLPLTPENPDHGGMRQLAKDASSQLWPAPPADKRP
jgi:LCP family protein required for cell wall assembly